MNNFAPILIPTLNRYSHFKHCVESLSKCKYAKDTELFIALDYPSSEKHWVGYKKIEKYITEIKGFKTINVIKRTENYGAVKNCFVSLEDVFKENDALIFTEDDNVFSHNFLEFINKGLEEYKDDENIFCINGYNYPVKMPSDYNEDIYFWKGMSAWGYGTWREKFNKVKFGIDEVNFFINKPLNILKLNRVAAHYFPGLLEIVLEEHITGDTVVDMYLINNNNYYSVFPTISKVRNYGHDGSGEHCGNMSDDIYSSQEIDSNESFEFKKLPIAENQEINRVLKNHFKMTWKGKIKVGIKYFKYLINY